MTGRHAARLEDERRAQETPVKKILRQSPWMLVMLAAVALLVWGRAGDLSAQWKRITVDTIEPTSTTATMAIGPSAAPMTVSSTGEVEHGLGHADGFVFLPAVHYCKATPTTPSTTASWPYASRLAANVLVLARGNASGPETIVWNCTMNSWLQRATGGTKGLKITSFDIVHTVRQVNLTSNTWGKAAIVTHVNATAPSVGSDLATAPTLETAKSNSSSATFTPYVKNVVLATPAYLPTGPVADFSVEWTTICPTNCAYYLYGLNVRFTRLD